MDIEKLIEKANHLGMELKRDGGEFEYSIGKKFLEYATALSTLQAENEKLRETVDKYATAARVIALHLKPFCDESLPYDEMIADAARKASDELERVKAERDAAVECINTVYSYILIKSKTDAVRTIEKWLRGQKED